MESAQTRVSLLQSLTRPQRKVLADLQLFQDKNRVTKLSVRQLAEITGVPRSTVCDALNRLNELQLVQTLTGTSLYPTIHRIRYQGPLRPSPCPVPEKAIGDRA